MINSKLLFPTKPLQLLPELAVLIGLNEALVLQQIHYWLSRDKLQSQSRRWIYNNFDEWQAQFPFCSAKTLQRTMKSLVDQKLIRVRKFNKKNWDRTNWYTIEYDTVARLGFAVQVLFEKHEEKRKTIARKRRLRVGHPVTVRETD